MIYSLALIAAVLGLILAKRRIEKLPREQRNASLRQWALIGGAVVIVGLVIAGRAPAIMAVLAGLMAVAGRVLQLAAYVPAFKNLFGSAANGESSQPPTHSAMSREQAAQVLGVEVSASDEEIKAAHKRLIQKLHPDRGGSEHLAKEINKAKDVLLNK